MLPENLETTIDRIGTIISHKVAELSGLFDNLEPSDADELNEVLEGCPIKISFDEFHSAMKEWKNEVKKRIKARTRFYYLGQRIAIENDDREFLVASFGRNTVALVDIHKGIVYHENFNWISVNNPWEIGYEDMKTLTEGKEFVVTCD